MANIFGFSREMWFLIFPAIGWYIGREMDLVEKDRSTTFRDKSQLYGRVLAPGEKPSWGR